MTRQKLPARQEMAGIERPVHATPLKKTSIFQCPQAAAALARVSLGA
jgi:hypothetical protein